MNTIDRFKIISGYVLGAAAYVGCFAVAVQLEDRWFNLVLCLFGGILGWCVGMFISPLSPDERLEFSELGKAISVFVSGFLIAKLEPLFSGITAKDVLTIATGTRWLLFGTTFCLGLQFTFVGRRYFRSAQNPVNRNDAFVIFVDRGAGLPPQPKAIDHYRFTVAENGNWEFKSHFSRETTKGRLGADDLKKWVKDIEHGGLHEIESNPELGALDESYMDITVNTNEKRTQVRIPLAEELSQAIEKKIVEVVKPGK